MTDTPCSANQVPIGRIDAGEPVNPCTIKTPIEPPSNRNGSQPGRIAGMLTLDQEVPERRRLPGFTKSWPTM